jgi:hypothetical protein
MRVAAGEDNDAGNIKKMPAEKRQRHLVDWARDEQLVGTAGAKWAGAHAKGLG